MAKIAHSLVDVVLGEAVSGTPAQRLDDMKAVVSGIVNRANALGVSPDDVISAKNQYDAYGKSLPPGVEDYRGLAEQAIAEVMAFGPTHTGTFQATPGAAKNLPSGLTPVAQTAGHVYFDDPQNRAIATAKGYITPNKAAIADPQQASFLDRVTSPLSATANVVGDLYSRFSPNPSVEVDVPTRPSGLGMAALAPNGLIDPSMGILSYDLENAKRNQVPTSGIGTKVHEVANDVIPGIDTSLYSGMEPPGKRVGAKNRHPLGFAGDFMFSKNGQQVVDPVAMHDIAMGMAAKYGANIGYSGIPGNYMGVGRMHIDTMPLGQYPGGPQWGPTAKSWAENLNFARETGIGPTPYSNAPTPSSRAAAVAEVAQAAKESQARSQMGQTMAQAGVSNLAGKQTASPTRPDNFSAPGQLVGAKAGGLGGLGGVATAPAQDPYSAFEAQRAAAFSSMPAPSFSPASISPNPVSSVASLSAPATASINPTAISSVASMPQSLTPSFTPTVVSPTTFKPTVAPMVTPTPVRVSPVTPRSVVAPQPTNSPQPAQVSTPSYSVADVYAGKAPAGYQAQATGGNLVSRDPETGNTSITNSFGVTSTFDPSGRQLGSLKGAPPGLVGAALGAALGGIPGAISGYSVGNRLGGKKSGGLGGLGGFLSDLFGGSSDGGGGSSGSSSSGGRSSGSGRAGADRDHSGNR